MNVQSMIKYAVGLVIGLVLVAGLIIPIVNNAQDHVGDKITYTNNTNIVLREVKSGDTLTCIREVTEPQVRTDTWYLNGEELTTLTDTTLEWNVALVSDGAYATVNAKNNSWAGIAYNVNGDVTGYNLGGSLNTVGTYTNTIAIGDDTITVTTYAGNTFTSAYTWGYIVCPYEEGKYSASVAGGSGYINKTNDVILCGVYTSGSNSTMYYRYDGITKVTEDYTAKTNISTQLVDGTTDVYSATVSVDIEGETFTPYRILLPYEVHGHKAEGANYTIIGVIPLLAITMLVIFAAAEIKSRRA